VPAVAIVWLALFCILLLLFRFLNCLIGFGYPANADLYCHRCTRVTQAIFDYDMRLGPYYL